MGIALKTAVPKIYTEAVRVRLPFLRFLAWQNVMNHENRLTEQFTSIINSFVYYLALGFHCSFSLLLLGFLHFLSLPLPLHPLVTPAHMIGVRDHLGFSMDGRMGQYLSKEDWSSNEGWTT